MKKTFKIRLGNRWGYAILMMWWMGTLITIAIYSPSNNGLWERIQMFISGTLMGAGTLYLAQKIGVLILKHRADYKITIDTEKRDK